MTLSEGALWEPITKGLAKAVGMNRKGFLLSRDSTGPRAKGPWLRGCAHLLQLDGGPESCKEHSRIPEPWGAREEGEKKSQVQMLLSRAPLGTAICGILRWEGWKPVCARRPLGAQLPSPFPEESRAG